MRRGALGAVLVAAAMAAPGVCAQDGGRLLVGSIGPEAEPVEIHQGVPEPLPVAPAPAGFVGPPEKPPTDLTAQERGESGGAPMASPTPAGSGGTDTGVSSGEGRPTPVIETTPLGGTGESAFRPRLGVGGESSKPSVSLRAGEGWWRTAAALAGTLALIFVIAAAVRRWGGSPGGLMHALGPGGRAPSGVLSVLGRYPVGRGQTLVLFKLDRRVLLVCQSAGSKGGGMRTLCELTDPEEVASVVMHAAESEGRSLSARFREMVSGFDQSYQDPSVVLAPVEVPGRAGAPVGAGGADPAERLHSRLDSLRRAGWGGVS